MKKFFNQDSTYNFVMVRLFDLLLLNILWYLTSIPLLTIGASTIALYDTTLKMIRNREGGIVRDFLKSFRSNFLQSIPATLILAAVLGILVADLHLLGGEEHAGAAILYGVCLVLLIALSALAGYVFPLMARFDNTVKNTFLNAGKIAAAHLPQTTFILVINSTPFLWFLISPKTFALIFWVWILIGISATAFINSFLLERIFDELISKKEEDI